MVWFATDDFRGLYNTLGACMSMALGIFPNYGAMVNESWILAPIFFWSVNLTLNVLMLNLLIAVFTDGWTVAKSELLLANEMPLLSMSPTFVKRFLLQHLHTTAQKEWAFMIRLADITGEMLWTFSNSGDIQISVETAMMVETFKEDKRK